MIKVGVWGPGSMGLWGLPRAADSYLGLLDQLPGRHAEAHELLHRAVDLDKAAAPALVARAQQWRAR